MKKLATTLLVIGGLAFATASHATVATYEFSFTAADMMRYVTANGADGSTAAGNSLFDGARLVRKNLASTADGYTRSYIGSENAAFTNWADSTTDQLLGFNLWGLDGRGAKWGEDFKPTAWRSQSDPAGWTNWQSNWPASWGPTPSGYITDVIPGWDATTYADALAFGNPLNAAIKYTFQVDLDTSDMFWNGATNGAPNTLPQLTLWFGGWMGAAGAPGDDINWNAPRYLYEGNMVLTGTQIPEPASLALVGLALAGLAAVRRRRV